MYSEDCLICPRKSFFINNHKNYSLTDASYELRSYERGVAQLGSAGALGALGRRCESCRPDSNYPSDRKVTSLSFLMLENKKPET